MEAALTTLITSSKANNIILYTILMEVNLSRKEIAKNNNSSKNYFKGRVKALSITLMLN